MFKNFLTLVIILFLSSITHCYKVSDFQPSILKSSPPSGYYNIETGKQNQGQILCFGDLNGDQYHDYIAYSTNKPSMLLIYLWNSKDSQFRLDSLSLSKYSGVIGKVQQVILADLSDDGSQQIIITYSKPSQTNTSKLYHTIVYTITQCGFMQCTYQQFQLAGVNLDNMTAPPTLINIQGISTSFIIFYNNMRYIVQKSQNIYNKKPFSDILNTQNKPTSYNKIDKHYTTNIDYNGDCHSDLVILSIDHNNNNNNYNNYVLQFYQKQTNSKYNLQKQLSLGGNVKFVTFIDFDASGTVDIVMINGELGKQKLYIMYNNYKYIQQDICQQFKQFPFDNSNVQVLSTPQQIYSDAILNFGDIDSDSYPDLLTIVVVNDFRKPVLYKNVQIDGIRQFVETTQLNGNLIYQMKNPKQIAFFDLGEDGKLDIFIMVQETRQSDGVSVITRQCFINNVKDDTLFIKIWPLSQTSTYQSGSTKLSSAFGITIQWRITKLDGSKKISLLNQKIQWNYGTLQLPFVTGGLGRTNNYVQDLTVGYQDVGQKMNWSPIIPNSKLLVYQKNKQWKLQTLLTNNQRVNHVIYVSVVILFVLGLVIFFLNYRQNQQDKKDQYNFIQLIR